MNDIEMLTESTFKVEMEIKEELDVSSGDGIEEQIKEEPNDCSGDREENWSAKIDVKAEPNALESSLEVHCSSEEEVVKPPVAVFVLPENEIQDCPEKEEKDPLALIDEEVHKAPVRIEKREKEFHSPVMESYMGDDVLLGMIAASCGLILASLLRRKRKRSEKRKRLNAKL